MKKRHFIPFFTITLTTFLLLVFLNSAYAKRSLPQPGATEEYFSENKNYRIEIKYLGEQPDKIVEVTLYEKDIKKWQKFYPVHPGLINVSDNGSRIVFANWGWYDEGGFKSLTICDGQGNVLKELMFSEIQESKRGYKDSLLWLHDAAISGNGDYYAMGTYGKEKAGIYLLDIKKATLLWQQACGYERLEDIKVFGNGSVLVATSDYPSGKLLFSILNNLGQGLWEKSCSWRISHTVADYLKIAGDSFGVLNTLDNDFITFQVKDRNIYPRNEFLIYKGGVGAIKCGMSIESLYFLYPYSIIKLLDLHAGEFSPFIGICFDGNRPSLLAELGWSNEKGWILNRIWVYDHRFKTETGIAVNSTLGDVKKANVISWITSNENRDVIGYIQELQIVFLIESSHVPEEFYKSHEVSLVPEDAKILAIGTPGGKIFSGPRCTSYFFPKLP
ncbi:MAG: hypothetical protein NTW93_01940 [Phycisphaerae bacterium]|nr:hypothetical protein [Phycisphaerae bacterium]